jgi:hypothetical protein
MILIIQWVRPIIGSLIEVIEVVELKMPKRLRQSIDERSEVATRNDVAGMVAMSLRMDVETKALELIHHSDFPL